MSSVRLTALCATALLLMSCAEGAAVGGEGESTVSPPPFDQTLPDPVAPLGPLGKQVDDLAQSGLPFVALRLEEPAKLWAYVPGSPESNADDAAASMAALVYSSREWGDVVVLEYLDTQTQEDLLAEAATFRDDGCSSVPSVGYDDAVHCEFNPFEQIQLGNGIIALLAIQEPLVSVGWVQSVTPSKSQDATLKGQTMKVEVYGDAAMVSREEAIDIATALAASGS
jgi:hypothetical protein